MAETCRRFTTCVYIIVFSYGTVVGMYMVTCVVPQSANLVLTFFKSLAVIVVLTVQRHSAHRVCLYLLCGSHHDQRLSPCTALFSITQTRRVYCAVRTKSLNVIRV